MILNTEINLCHSISDSRAVIYIASQSDRLPEDCFSPSESTYFSQNADNVWDTKWLISPECCRFLHRPDLLQPKVKQMEMARMSANKIYSKLKEEKISAVSIVSEADGDVTIAFIEGLLLSTYGFEKYKSKKSDYVLSVINVVAGVAVDQLSLLKATVQGVFAARDLVNEPANALDAIELSKQIEYWAQKCGFTVQTLYKEAIEQHKMGGLLGVNQGSITPPTFNILEWKPLSAEGKPLVIVGKGVMFDTGGINLKVQPGGLDDMKSDMAGAAAVIGTFIAAAGANLPIHLIGLIPATDNRPGNNALVPGDIITMHDGTTVEILNTDAEGRLILADAISFANRYEPQLIVELSTLTGSTVMTLGSQGMAAMGCAADEVFDLLQQSGARVHERMARFPFWEEYEELIKSDVADLKNIGGREAGAITAGKFLNHFTNHPFIHLDIAGVAFLRKENGYRGLGATGTGVRLLTDFAAGLASHKPAGALNG